MRIPFPSLLPFCGLFGFLAAGLAVSGCGVGAVDTSTTGSLSLGGKAVGGQQGVAGATIQLYRAGKTGNGSASVALLTTAVTTDKFGFFSITGDYSCASSSDQVYLMATGGNPGLAAGTNNASIAMMAALGDCGALLSQGANAFIWVNEITTAAAAWALAPFLTGPAFTGTILANQVTAGGITNPAHLSVDAGGTVWVANYHGSSISAISSGTVAGEPAVGTAISPSAGLELDANLVEPFAVVPDRSGNLWVSIFYQNNLVMFLGLATPTSTPMLPLPTAP